jgi:hypothetical protein
VKDLAMPGLDLSNTSHRKAVGLAIAHLTPGIKEPYRAEIQDYADAVTDGTLQDILHTYGALGPVVQDLVAHECKSVLARLEKNFLRG